MPEEYWTIDASLSSANQKKPIIAKYYGEGDKKVDITNKAQADRIVKDIKDADFVVSEVKTSDRTKKAPLPFTTSTLQQEASKALNFTTSKTMRIAQQLYEGVNIKGHGTVGIITYLRTDSTRISDDAQRMAHDYIRSRYGERYLNASDSMKKDDKKIQDAHEAIRPTDLELDPITIKESLSRDQLRLYQLIYKRFLASRMANALYETTSVKMDASSHRFTVSASKIKFDGFMSVYTDADDENEPNTLQSAIGKGDVLKSEDVEAKQHFTQPPAHYTEATLVRALEELGIGRPSTYAPTIAVILSRRYIAKEGRNIFVTEIGEVVNDMMKDAFPEIVDVNFTANMETLLDGVEEGTVKWKTIIENFYPDLENAVNNAEKELEQVKIQDELSDEICELCGRRMVIKYGAHGKFIACPGFPECKNTKPFFEKIDVACPKCGKDIVIKRTRKGRRYYGCMGAPECDYMTWGRPKDTEDAARIFDKENKERSESAEKVAERSKSASKTKTASKTATKTASKAKTTSKSKAVSKKA